MLLIVHHYESFQQHIGLSDSDTKLDGTRTDSRLHATQWLFEASNQLNNVVCELEAYVQVFESEDSTARMRLEAMRNIKRTIIPVITKVSNLLFIE